MSIEQETRLIELLKTMNNKDVKDQIEHAERRLRHLERDLKRRREEKSFVRRIEKEVELEKMQNLLVQHGLLHLCKTFKHISYREFKHSDPVDWPPLSETDLRQLLFLR